MDGALLTLRQVADRLKVSLSTVRREILDGRLSAVRIRSLLRVQEAALDAYVRQMEEHQAIAVGRAPASRGAGEAWIEACMRVRRRAWPSAWPSQSAEKAPQRGRGSVSLTPTKRRS